MSRRGLFAAVAGIPLWIGAKVRAAAAGIPRGFEQVDPRTARRVALWQELSPANPIFPDDPPFHYRVFTTVAESGYLLEQITSLGTHTGTHVSAPAHFVEGAAALSQLDESWTLMPLVVLDVRQRVAASGGDFTLSTRDVQQFERRHGRIPRNACVLLRSGFGAHYSAPDYFASAPGFSGDATTWLFEARAIKAIGADTFGPDASSDSAFGSTSSALAHGGVTVENVGPGLAQMRAYGDWISINGARPCCSGFQVGITGFTLP